MMAIRDMDIAAEIIGIRPLRTKLIAFAVSSYIIGVAGALWLFLVQGNLEADAFDILTMSFPILFMIIVGGLGIGDGVDSRCMLPGHDAGAHQEFSRRPRARQFVISPRDRGGGPHGEVRPNAVGATPGSPWRFRPGS